MAAANGIGAIPQRQQQHPSGWPSRDASAPAPGPCHVSSLQVPVAPSPTRASASANSSSSSGAAGGTSDGPGPSQHCSKAAGANRRNGRCRCCPPHGGPRHRRGPLVPPPSAAGPQAPANGGVRESSPSTARPQPFPEQPPLVPKERLGDQASEWWQEALRDAASRAEAESSRTTTRRDEEEERRTSYAAQAAKQGRGGQTYTENVRSKEAAAGPGPTPRNEAASNADSNTTTTSSSSSSGAGHPFTGSGSGIGGFFSRLFSSEQQQRWREQAAQQWQRAQGAMLGAVQAIESQRWWAKKTPPSSASRAAPAGQTPEQQSLLSDVRRLGLSGVLLGVISLFHLHAHGRLGPMADSALDTLSLFWFLFVVLDTALTASTWIVSAPVFSLVMATCPDCGASFYYSRNKLQDVMTCPRCFERMKWDDGRFVRERPRYSRVNYGHDIFADEPEEEPPSPKQKFLPIVDVDATITDK